MKCNVSFPKLFETGQIGQLTLRNRLIMAPMGTGLTSDTGAVSQRQIDYYCERAKGGVGMIIVECTSVNTGLAGWSGGLRIDTDRFIRSHADLVEAVHRYGARIALQLYHPGRATNVRQTEGIVPVAPSAIPLKSAIFPTTDQVRELSVDEIQELVEGFAQAALRARMANYDAVEVHGAHGYLIFQFISAHSNKRTDQYGGTIENRMKFPVDIIRRVKQIAGTDFPVLFRFTALETMGKGDYTIEDSKIFAQYAQEAGADALHVSMGSFSDKDGISRNVCPMSFPQGWRIPYTEAIKKIATIPVITVGVIREPDFAERVLAEGKADFIALGRALIADPYWPNKVARGEVDDIRKCPSCNSCLGHLRSSRLHCAINAAAANEREFQITPASNIKRVMVLGSGPGGLEFARVAALRGHIVSLYEKGPLLGYGQFVLIDIPPHKEKMAWVREFLIHQVRKLDIEVHLNTEVNEDLVLQAKPHVVIVATGARPIIPDIPGVNSRNVLAAPDVLRGLVEIKGKKVAVLGQFSTGAETALYLAEMGNKVTIIARSSISYLGFGAKLSNMADLAVRIKKDERISVLNEHDIKEISGKGVTLVNKKDGREFLLEVNKVILARGVTPINELANQLDGKIPEVYIIGNAKQPRDIESAIYEGAVVARVI